MNWNDAYNIAVERFDVTAPYEVVAEEANEIMRLALYPNTKNYNDYDSRSANTEESNKGNGNEAEEAMHSVEEYNNYLYK